MTGYISPPKGLYIYSTKSGLDHSLVLKVLVVTFLQSHLKDSFAIGHCIGIYPVITDELLSALIR